MCVGLSAAVFFFFFFSSFFFMPVCIFALIQSDGTGDPSVGAGGNGRHDMTLGYIYSTIDIKVVFK